GEVLDVLSVPAALGSAVHRVLSRSTATAITPAARWLFVVTPGELLPTSLAAAGVVRHGAGEWVAVPPAPLRRGRPAWLVEPQVVRWRPAPAAFVHAVLTNALWVGDARNTVPGARGLTGLDHR
nr:DNA primase [Actinomycetota bacterium]